MLIVSGLYLILTFSALGVLGTRGDLPKFVKLMRVAVPSGIFVGIIDLLILLL